MLEQRIILGQFAKTVVTILFISAFTAMVANGEPITYNACKDFSKINAGKVPFYKDKGRNALAIDASNANLLDKFARAEKIFNLASGTYSVTITTLTEEDGESTYRLMVNDVVKGTFQNPQVGDSGDNKPCNHTWASITMKKGDTIAIESNTNSNKLIPEGKGFAWARGRWRIIVLTPVKITPLPKTVPGRFAFSHDGNQHDEDDIGALGMMGALIWSGGINDRVVHIVHSDHLGNNNPTQHKKMIETAKGIIDRFKINSKIVFDAQSQLSEALANFKKEAEKSSETNPLWFLCAGPMEVPWQCLKTVDRKFHPYIHCVSHARWNENHIHKPQITHTWKSMKKSFPDVEFHKIKDQNGRRNNKGVEWATELEKWNWLRDSTYEPYRWLHSRNQFTKEHKAPRFDVSDAGMLYYLLSGGPKDGKMKSGVNEAKALLNGVIKNEDQSQ